MKRKIVSGIMLALLLVSMLTLAFDIRLVKASGTIYIRADGSIDPPTAPMYQYGGIYYLTGNIDGSSILIEKDNIMLVGEGYILQGPGTIFINGIDVGLYVYACSNVEIIDLEVESFDVGVYLFLSSYVSILGSRIANNSLGIVVSGGSNNKLDGNIVTNNNFGICLLSSFCNIVAKNIIDNNNMSGILLSGPFGGCADNVIFHNDFIGNTKQVETILFRNETNVWDNGYPYGGNYWSDYTGVDLYSGPFQNETGSDGIWDHQYVIAENNTDCYPLMYPWIARPDLSASIDWISDPSPDEGERVTISARVTNNGNVDSIKSYISLNQKPAYQQPIVCPPLEVEIDSKPLGSIGPGKSETVNFVWNAVQIVNDDPNKRLYVVAHSPRDAHPEDNVAYVHLNKIANVGFDMSKHAFSFENWKSDMSERLKNFIGRLFNGPFAATAADFIYNVVGGWHCYGMAAASAAFYKDNKNKPQRLRQEETFNMLKDDIKNEIEDYHCYQGASDVMRIVFEETINLRQEYNKIVYYIKDEKTPVIMGILLKYPSGEKKLHAVTVFNYFDIDSDRKNIVAYDSEELGMAVVFTFHLDSNTISSQMPRYGNIEKAAVAPPANPFEAKKGIEDSIEGLRNQGGRTMPVYCPVNITITDQFGRMISESENQIPSARFEHYNTTDARIFFLPADLQYNVHIYANNAGNCTICQITPAESIYESVISLATFNVTEKTEAHFDLLPFDANYTIQIDENGDGAIDYELTPERSTYNSEYDIGVAEVVQPKTVVGQDCNLSITTTVANYGAYTQTFNVTVYANETLIESKTVVLESKNSTTFKSIWNTTEATKGDYIISVYAWPVQGETETTDNDFTDGMVSVAIFGDINADGKVDVKDVYAVAKDYGTSQEGPDPPYRTYHPNNDINCDGKIDVKDYYIVCKNYGKTDP